MCCSPSCRQRTDFAFSLLPQSLHVQVAVRFDPILVDFHGQRLPIATAPETTPSARHHLFIKCNAPEIAFRATKRACPKVTGIMFNPQGTCGMAAYAPLPPPSCQAIFLK